MGAANRLRQSALAWETKPGNLLDCDLLRVPPPDPHLQSPNELKQIADDKELLQIALLLIERGLDTNHAPNYLSCRQIIMAHAPAWLEHVDKVEQKVEEEFLSSPSNLDVTCS
eukprot:c3498_g1_i2.p1 GENE.c3498_g1_i2~~c3498_g1_i2.p1  ORF type:complete len:113 (+),score=25.84 c3498_g1_i2:1-339(+)